MTRALHGKGSAWRIRAAICQMPSLLVSCASHMHSACAGQLKHAHSPASHQHSQQQQPTQGAITAKYSATRADLLTRTSERPLPRLCCSSFPLTATQITTANNEAETDGDTNGASSSQNAGSGSTGSDANGASQQPPRSLKWLDKEVKAGRQPEARLTGSRDGGDGDRPRTDVMLRSYSKKAACASLQVVSVPLHDCGSQMHVCNMCAQSCRPRANLAWQGIPVHQVCP